MTLTSEQVRAARALLRWEQKDLAAASSVSLPSIKRLEARSGPLAAQERTAEAIRRALEQAGVVFETSGEAISGGPGVRMASDMRTAIIQATEHVRKYAAMGLWDVYQPPTDADIEERRLKVLALCEDLEALANRVETEDIRFPDFEVLRAKLSDLNAYMQLADLSAVAAAFGRAGRLDRR